VRGVFAGEVVAKFPAQLLLLPVAPGVRPTLCSLSLSVLTIDNISNSHPPASWRRSTLLRVAQQLVFFAGMSWAQRLLYVGGSS